MKTTRFRQRGFAKRVIGVSLGAVLVVSLLCYLCLSMWYSPAIRGRLVDANTQQPIASAVLVATWEVSGWEGFVIKQLAVRESMTGADGRFEIAAWGPRFNFGAGSVRGNQPTIRVWADGYVPRILSNTPERSVPNLFAFPIILSRLNDDVVRIERASSADPAYILALEGLARSMEFAYRGERCEWREVPRMLVALHRTKNVLTTSGRADFLRPVDHIVVRELCGDPAEFFREYLP